MVAECGIGVPPHEPGKIEAAVVSASGETFSSDEETAPADTRRLAKCRDRFQRFAVYPSTSLGASSLGWAT